VDERATLSRSSSSLTYRTSGSFTTHSVEKSVNLQIERITSCVPMMMPTAVGVVVLWCAFVVLASQK